MQVVVKGPRIMGALSRTSTGGYSAVNCLNERNNSQWTLRRAARRPLALKRNYLSIYRVRRAADGACNKTTKRDIAARCPSVRFIIWSGSQIKGFAVTPRSRPSPANNHLCIKSNCVFKFDPYNAEGRDIL